MTETKSWPALPILELHQVCMQFGGLTALKELSYDVPDGIVQAVIGPNGAGKTTLFHCITGIHQPTSGRVLFDGRQISGKFPHQIAEAGISRTFQHVAVFRSMSVLENIMVGRHCRTHSGFWATGLRFPGMRAEEKGIRESALSQLEFVGLEDVVEQQAGTLPLGKQKILEIARALATNPRLILLDEPAGGLNMRETEELGALIQRICRRGTTVMLVEHDMNLVMDISDLVLVLHYGEFLAAGTPSEIKDRPEVIEAYLGEG